MPDPVQGGTTAQSRSLSPALALDPGLILGRVPSIERLAQAPGRHAGQTRDRVYTPAATLAVSLSQTLPDDHSCRAAVARSPAWRASRGLPPCSPDAGGYCKARRRSPETPLPRLVRDPADRPRERAPRPGRPTAVTS